MSSSDLDVVTDVRASLGEGPVWDSRIDRLVWIDIFGRLVHMTDPATGSTRSLDVPLHIGSIVPRPAGGYVAALQDGFWIVGDGDPERIAPVDVGEGMRFNDGKCDPYGRFWAGTMSYEESQGRGSLYRLDPHLVVSKQLDDVTVSNGLAWSGDGETMYYIDTPRRRIEAFAFDGGSGTISDRRTVVEIADGAGYPDGMTIDEQGGLWVALWDGGAVHRYVDGRLDRVVHMPVSRPTSCAFGGPELDVLYVTSAAVGLSETQRAAQPEAGALFRIATDVGGGPPVAFAGV